MTYTAPSAITTNFPHSVPASGSAAAAAAVSCSPCSSIDPSVVAGHVQSSAGHQNHLTFPGTFKSMLNPSISGDISISIPGYSSINDLFPVDDKDSVDSANDAENDDKHPKTVVKSKEFAAKIHLTYRTVGGHGPGMLDQNQMVVPPANGQQSSVPSPIVSQRRASISCRGKISVSGLLNNNANNNIAGNNSSSSASQSSEEDAHVLKQYEMMFVQSDFDPSMQFFAVTFSKTLVQNTSIPSIKVAGFDDEHSYPGNHQQQHHDNRGLMLSGHYSMIRGYDVGTVRVHLPGYCMRGDLAPVFTMSHAADLPKESPRNMNKPVSADLLSAPAPPPGLFANSSPVAQSSPYGKPRHPSVGSSGSPYVQSPAVNKPVRYCYGCGDSGHLHKDCPRDQLFCYNCNQNGHSSKNCKKPKPWQQHQQPQTNGGSDNSDLSSDSILAAGSVTASGQYQAKKPLPNFVPRHQTPSMPGGGKQHLMPQQQQQPYGATWNMKPMQESLPSYGQPSKHPFSPNGMSPYMQQHMRQPQTPPSPVSMQISPTMKPHINAHDMSYGAIGSPLVEQSSLTSPDIRSRTRGYTTSLILGGNGGNNMAGMNNNGSGMLNSTNASIHGKSTGRRPPSFASFSPNSPGNFLLETVDDFELAQNGGHMGPAGDMDSFLGRLTDIDEHESVQTTPTDLGYTGGGYHHNSQYPFY